MPATGIVLFYVTSFIATIILSCVARLYDFSYTPQTITDHKSYIRYLLRLQYPAIIIFFLQRQNLLLLFPYQWLSVEKYCNERQ